MRLRSEHAPGGVNGRESGSTFARNAATSYGQRAVLGLSALLLTPYLFRALGVGGFGTWSVMFTLTTVFAMLELGFSAGITKLVAELRAKASDEDLSSIVGASVTLMAGLGALGFGVSLAVAALAPGLAAAEEREAFQIGMTILGGAILLRFPLAAYGAALTGYQRWDLYNASQAATVVGFAIGAVLAIESGTGVLGLAVAYAVALLAGGCAYVPLLRHTDVQLALRPRLSEPEMRRRILAHSSFTLLADSMIFVGVRMDTVMIAAIVNAAAAAPFAAASKLQNGLQALTLPLINMMMPMVSELDAQGRRDEVVRRFTFATRMTLQVTLPVAVGVALFASDFVSVWLGPTAPSVTAAIVAILALQTVMLSAVPADKVMIGIGRARVIGVMNTVEGLSNLTISILLVSAHGAIGAALGTLISSCLMGPVKFPLACRAAGCSTSRFLRSSLVPAVASSLPALALMLALWLTLPSGLPRLAAGMTAGILAAAAVAVIQLGPRRTLTSLTRLPKMVRRKREPDDARPPLPGPS